MTMPNPVVFLLDSDNALLDSDRFAIDFGACLQQADGPEERDRFLAVKRLVAHTELGMGVGVAACAGSAKHMAL